MPVAKGVCLYHLDEFSGSMSVPFWPSTYELPLYQCHIGPIAMIIFGNIRTPVSTANNQYPFPMWIVYSGICVLGCMVRNSFKLRLAP